MGKFANITLGLAVLYCASILGYALYRWLNQGLEGAEAVLYIVVPAILAGALAACFRLGRDGRATAALILLGAGAGTYAAEGYLALRVHPIRSQIAFVEQLRRQGLEAYPFVNPDALLRPGPDGVLRSILALDGIEVLPLAQVPDTFSVACNETGEHMTYRIDEHGFRNPAGLWDAPRIDIAAVGDSFVEGDCVPQGRNMISWVRQARPNTINLGVGGTGPLAQLAILKEYASRLAPKIVIWAFYEGNDLGELIRERRSPLLMRYLDPGFSQGLPGRRDEIRAILADFLEEQMHKVSDSKDFGTRLVKFATLYDLREELRLSLGGGKGAGPDELRLLAAILAEANAAVTSWGGALRFVYLPSAARYFGAEDDERVLRATQERVRRIVVGLQVPFVNVAAAFDAAARPKALWFHADSHYNEEGYRVAGQAILDSLDASGD
ncbi:MAG: GDSL-type esterase/lipase family protein [Kiloniellaceae bacterium]